MDMLDDTERDAELDGAEKTELPETVEPDLELIDWDAKVVADCEASIVLVAVSLSIEVEIDALPVLIESAQTTTEVNEPSVFVAVMVE